MKTHERSLGQNIINKSPSLCVSLNGNSFTKSLSELFKKHELKMSWHIMINGNAPNVKTLNASVNSLVKSCTF